MNHLELREKSLLNIESQKISSYLFIVDCYFMYSHSSLLFCDLSVNPIFSLQKKFQNYYQIDVIGCVLKI